MNKKILVVGGTGNLGRPVVWRLIYDGFKVKVLSHIPDGAEQIFRGAVEVIEGDVTKSESLPPAMRGCDAVYINLGAKMNIDDFDRIEAAGTFNISNVASDMKISRIGMISDLNAGSTHINNKYFKAKRRAEAAVIDSGVPYTIFRCCNFFDSLPLYIVDKRAMIFGSQKYKRSWIFSGDYATMVSKAFSNDKSLNKTFHIRGPEKLTVREALQNYLDIAFPEAKITVTPLWLLKILSMMTRNKNLKGLTDYMKGINQVAEIEDFGDEEIILGPARTTLKEWVTEYLRKR